MSSKVLLVVLAVHILSCSAAVLKGFPTVCDSANFTIQCIEQFGYVHHYGIYEKLDLLEFSTTLSPTHFVLKSNGALQDVETGKCVNSITRTHFQLVLSNVCSGPDVDLWTYNSSNERLVNINTGLCFSPWYYPLSPSDVSYVPGLSPCADYNRMILTPNPQQNKEKLRKCWT
ncbi:uncharacterized protein LOC114526472 [Dendronephthya gigantea]|uniref:uncharacterized protein LOC114526472 n=1 Tax=Dendronephthya gigantea TaxID=151771 RepID=UPI0010697505|nr:uncharacterized protein LOC114526472 [Dendronephthya gigantea]